MLIMMVLLQQQAGWLAGAIFDEYSESSITRKYGSEDNTALI